MTIEEMKQKRRILGYSYKTLSEKSGVPLGTLQKIFGGYSKSPRENTIYKLAKALDDPDTYTYIDGHSPNLTVHDAVREYHIEKKQGEYTLEDYYAIPDEYRAELIDGVLYDMTAPRVDHQMVAGQIYAMLLSYISQNGGTCIPFIAPADVQLDKDDKTMIQPDVFVVCDRSKINGKNLFGAPDFIVEILSPSTSKKDRYIKSKKYKYAGVREYWLVDLKKEVVIVTEFKEDDEDIVTIYHFTDQIPVGIYHGDCKIDFAVIRDYIGFLKD